MEKELAAYEIDLRDGAIDDLRSWINDLKRENASLKELLQALARRINGASSSCTIDQLRMLPVQFDVLMQSKKDEFARTNDRLRVSRLALNRSITKHNVYRLKKSKQVAVLLRGKSRWSK